LSWQIGSRAKIIFEYFYNFRETQAYFETPVLGYDPNGIRTLDGVYHSYGNRRLNWAEDDDFRRQRRQFASYDFRLGILKNLHFRSQFQYESKKADFAETFVKGDALVLLYDAALYPRYYREWKQDTTAWRLRNELVWEGRTGPFKHQFLAGFGWVREETDEILNRTPWNNGGLRNDILDELNQPTLSGDGRLRDDTWTRSANPAYLYNEYPGVTLEQFLVDPTLAGFNLNNIMPVVMFDRSKELPVPDRSTLALYPDRNLNRQVSNIDWYANDMISFARDRIVLSGGLRHIDAKRRNINRLTGAFPKYRVLLENPVPTDDEDSVTTYSGGLVWHIDERKMFTLYGNLNSSFAVEWRTQPDGTELKPERGRQKEAGLRINAFGGRLAMLATYFDIKQENVTQADPNRAANSGWYVQLDGVRSQGFEFSVNARVTRDWNLMAGYAYTDARQSEDPVNPDVAEEIPRELVPNNRFTLRSQFDGSRGFLRGWRFGCGIIYTGSRPLTSVSGRGANILATDASRVAGKEVNWGPLAPQWNVDASIGYRWRPRGKKVKQVETILRVKNLFNDTDLFYVATTNRYTVDPGRECQFLFSVRF
jgi:outer membrane receptor protein involved in Fe transport